MNDTLRRTDVGQAKMKARAVQLRERKFAFLGKVGRLSRLSKESRELKNKYWLSRFESSSLSKESFGYIAMGLSMSAFFYRVYKVKRNRFPFKVLMLVLPFVFGGLVSKYWSEAPSG